MRRIRVPCAGHTDVAGLVTGYEASLIVRGEDRQLHPNEHTGGKNEPVAYSVAGNIGQLGLQRLRIRGVEPFLFLQFF